MKELPVLRGRRRNGDTRFTGTLASWRRPHDHGSTATPTIRWCRRVQQLWSPVCPARVKPLPQLHCIRRILPRTLVARSTSLAESSCRLWLVRCGRLERRMWRAGRRSHAAKNRGFVLWTRMRRRSTRRTSPTAVAETAGIRNGRLRRPRFRVQPDTTESVAVRGSVGPRRFRRRGATPLTAKTDAEQRALRGAPN